MANDITNINSNRSQLNSSTMNPTKPSDETKTGGSENSPAANTQDRVTLTDTAARLQNIEQKLNNTPPVDSERVAAVQKAVSNGEYKVDSDRIADKMLAFEDIMMK